MRLIEADITIPISLDGNIIVREAGLVDLLLFEKIAESSELAWWRDLLEKGRHCVIVLRDDQLLAYGWFSLEVDPHIDRVFVPLADDEGYLFDLYTLPHSRQQGLQKLLHLYILHLMHSLNCNRVFSLVEVNNLPSLEFHRKMGYQILSRLTRICVLGWVYFGYNPNPFA